MNSDLRTSIVLWCSLALLGALTPMALAVEDLDGGTHSGHATDGSHGPRLETGERHGGRGFGGGFAGGGFGRGFEREGRLGFGDDIGSSDLLLLLALNNGGFGWGGSGDGLGFGSTGWPTPTLWPTTTVLCDPFSWDDQSCVWETSTSGWFWR